MKFTKLTKLLILTIAVLFAWSSGALAGGGPAGDLCWLTDNPSGGALALKATIAVVYTPSEANVDAVLRIQRGSDQAFYRINLIETSLREHSDELIGNKLLNSCIYLQDTPNWIRVNQLVNDITAHFFGAAPGEMEFVITSRSVSNTDYNEDEIVRAIDDTGRAGSIADLTLYAVDKLP